jgi:hypothetical protein
MLKDYSIFLTQLKKKYEFKFFNEKISKYNNIILRHDVDYHIDYALRIAQLEKNLKIKSTYFFLLRSDFYNLISQESVIKINIIKKLGHEISIHFDTKIYNRKIKENFFKEKSYFENVFNTRVKVISFHRPQKKYLYSQKNFFGISHSYQKKYISDIKYVSDSKNNFLHGNPLSSSEFKKNKSMQILIHPIWWVSKFNQKSKIKFKKLLQDKQNQLIQNLKKNSYIFTL